MRYVKDFGEVHENASPGFVELAKADLSMKIIPAPHFSSRGTAWSFSVRVYRNEGAGDWGCAEGFDPDETILKAIKDYNERIKFKEGRDG